jgi:DNA-binding NarL/FixJ family response regulator
MDRNRIKILLYDDNKPLREGLTMLLNGTNGFSVVGAFAHCNQVVEEVERLKPDIVLMDIDMPGMGGINGLKLIKTRFPTVKVVMLTVFADDQNVFQAMKASADGYLLKKTAPAKLLEAIQEACEGGAPMTSSIARQVLELFARQTAPQPDDLHLLSAREKEVLDGLVKGYSYKLIAAELSISLETVRSHIKKIYEKLRVNSKTEAITKVYKGRNL